jgi:predicted transcriptional regulator
MSRRAPLAIPRRAIARLWTRLFAWTRNPANIAGFPVRASPGFGYHAPMKTRSIEVDDDTATALTQRAAERGVSVPELVAELVTLEAGPVVAEAGDIAELDQRWKAFEAQGSVATSDEVVRWLQTWGTPAFRDWRKR